MTRAVRRGFFSDERAAAAQAGAPPRASNDSTWCTCLASRLQKSKRSIFPGLLRGTAATAGQKPVTVEMALRTRGSTRQALVTVGRRRAICGGRKGAGNLGARPEKTRTWGPSRSRDRGPIRRKALRAVLRGHALNRRVFRRPWRCGEPPMHGVSRATRASGPGQEILGAGATLRHVASEVMGGELGSLSRTAQGVCGQRRRTTCSSTRHAHRCDRSCRG